MSSYITVAQATVLFEACGFTVWTDYVDHFTHDAKCLAVVHRDSTAVDYIEIVPKGINTRIVSAILKTAKRQ